MELISPTVQNLLSINGEGSGVVDPVRVDKPWGYELWFTNRNDYCSKLIHIEAGKGDLCSMHFHVIKHETLIVGAGLLHLDLIPSKGTVQTIDLGPGRAFCMAPGMPHRLRPGPDGVDVYEASTTHYDEDSVRLY